MNINQLIDKSQRGDKLTMVTCYDHAAARIINQCDVDMILVGDSAAMVMHGESSTLPIDTATMAMHTRSVVKGAPDKFIVADMPFMSFRKSLDANMTAVEQLMKTGAHAIKLEGVLGNEDLIKHIIQSGVPVMGHLGLTPQSVNQFGGFKVQGRDEAAAQAIIDQVKSLQDLGAFSVVLECVPSSLTARVVSETSIMTIGIGAGPETHGQVLVMHDLLGYPSDFRPKFVRQYLDTEALFKQAFNAFAKDVQTGQFPNDEEGY